MARLTRWTYLTGKGILAALVSPFGWLCPGIETARLEKA